MYRILPIFILTICGLSFAPLIRALPLIAQPHQAAARTVGATIHLAPSDMPQAGRTNLTWFMLTQRGGQIIPSTNCACQVAVYDSSNHPIARNLPLSTLAVRHYQAIATKLTFPKPGTYTIALSGQSQDQRFDPFELIFPILVSP